MGCVSDASVSALVTVTMGLVVQQLLMRVRSKAVADGIEVKPEDLAEFMSIEERQTLFSDYFERLKAPILEIVQDASAFTVEGVQNAIESMQYYDDQ